MTKNTAHTFIRHFDIIPFRSKQSKMPLGVFRFRRTLIKITIICSLLAVFFKYLGPIFFINHFNIDFEYVKVFHWELKSPIDRIHLVVSKANTNSSTESSPKNENNAESIESSVFDEKKRKTFEYLMKATAKLPRSPNDYPAPIAHFPSIHSATCLITKNANSVIRYVNCLLGLLEARDTRSFSLIEKEDTLKAAHSRKCYSNLSRRRRKFKRVRSELLVFVRNPLDRFVSGWLFLCKRKKICFDCGQENFGCFLKTLYNCWRTRRRYSRICRFNFAPRSRSRHRRIAKKTSKNEAKHNTSTYLYWHVLPQAAFCQLYKRKRQFTIANYSRENVNEYLLDAAKPLLSEKQMTALEERLGLTTPHAANVSDAEDLKNLIKKDRTLSSMFAQLYFIDYRTFDLELPEFIVDFKLYEGKEETPSRSNGTKLHIPASAKKESGSKQLQLPQSKPEPEPEPAVLNPKLESEAKKDMSKKEMAQESGEEQGMNEKENQITDEPEKMMSNEADDSATTASPEIAK